MTTDSTFKIGIYEQVAEQMNEAHIVHCAAHGIDYRINHYGRDVDVMIRHQDRHKVRRIISDVFEKNNIHFKINKFSWADWIIGYKVVGNEISFIEIDLFYHIYYRMIELTDPKLLGVSKDPHKFHIADWNTYAKVVLLKFFGLNFRKLKEKKWNEVKRVAALVEGKNSNIYEQLVLELNKAIFTDDYDAIKRLKTEYPVRRFAWKHPVRCFAIFASCMLATIDRRLHAFSIIPVLFLPSSCQPAVESYRDIIVKESFLTCVNETMCDGLGVFFSALLSYRHHSEPLSLNIIYAEPTVFVALKNNYMVKCLSRPLEVLSIRSIFENIC